MPVTYPITLPTVGVTNISWNNVTSSFVSRSPFSFKGQAIGFGGSIRTATVSVEGLNRASSENWIGFLDSLNGTIGTFLMGDPAAKSPIGVGTNKMLTLNSISAVGDGITIQADSAGSINNLLVRGDWIQIGSGVNARLYKVVSESVSLNTTGLSNQFFVWPKVRTVNTTGSDVFINNPVGLFRRSSGSYGYTESNDCRYSISFDCEEVV